MQNITMSCLLAFTGLIANAQITCSGGHTFKMPSSTGEWSEVVKKDLASVKMEENNVPAVPLEIRVRVLKKVVWACHYEVEIKNVSPTQGIAFSAFNDYTDATSKYIYHKVKLKPGETTVFKIIFGDLKCKPKSDADCSNLGCPWELQFQDIKTL
jgi:hypothetical protein